MTRTACLALLLVAALAGCAEKKAVVAPESPSPSRRALPRPPRPVKKEAVPPAPAVLPELGHANEEQLKEEAEGKLEGAERVADQIDQERLAPHQHDTFLTIQSFLAKAREALSLRDFLKALNLADKAQVLAEELLRGLR
jgi:hypothetical protein